MNNFFYFFKIKMHNGFNIFFFSFFLFSYDFPILSISYNAIVFLSLRYFLTKKLRNLVQILFIR